MNIRPATPADSRLLSSLCVDVQRLHADHHPGLFKPPQTDDFAAAFFDQMLADPLVNIFVAEEDDQALGYILCKLIERPETPFTFAMRFLLVDQISVRLQAQGRGVGSALLAQADDLAQESDVSRIQLDSWGFNTSAHAFFEHNGYEKFNYRFWREIE